jgi:tetrahydromethanopterin S-methyltransferase subunit E
MTAVPIHYLAVVIAAIAGFLVGWGWYTIFGKVWMDALSKTKGDCKPTPLPFIVAAWGVS